MTKKIFLQKRLHISKIICTFAPDFQKGVLKPLWGPRKNRALLRKCTFFGESGGTSRPVDLTEWYQHYDLVAEREQKYQRLRHYFCMKQIAAYQYFTTGLTSVVGI